MTFLSPGTASHQLAPKTFLKECTCESIFGTPQGKKFKIKPRLWVSGLARGTNPETCGKSWTHCKNSQVQGQGWDATAHPLDLICHSGHKSVSCIYWFHFCCVCHLHVLLYPQ